MELDDKALEDYYLSKTDVQAGIFRIFQSSTSALPGELRQGSNIFDLMHNSYTDLPMHWVNWMTAIVEIMVIEETVQLFLWAQ